MNWRLLTQSVACFVVAVGGAFSAPMAHAQDNLLLTYADSVAASAPSNREQVGRATWYGEDFDGRTTAAGERFDMYSLSAAHPSLPMGSIVEVTNLQNGRKLTVRINDRRAPGAGGVIVLSKAAAANLGFVDAGDAQVHVKLISTGSQARPVQGWTQASAQ